MIFHPSLAVQSVHSPRCPATHHAVCPVAAHCPLVYCLPARRSPLDVCSPRRLPRAVCPPAQLLFTTRGLAGPVPLQPNTFGIFSFGKLMGV
jgi:hypothetical protein